MNVFSNECVALLGMSPRNPYYNDPENIVFALTESLKRNKAVFVYIPGVHDWHNYCAYGYDEETAKLKACEIGRKMEAAVREVCRAKGLTCGGPFDSQAQVRLIDWARDIENTTAYQENLAQLAQSYRTNAAFREDIRAASRATLETHMAHNGLARKRIQKAGIGVAVESAVPYILGEFALIQAAGALFGGRETTYSYHRPWPVFERYVVGNYGASHPALHFSVLARPSPVEANI